VAVNRERKVTIGEIGYTLMTDPLQPEFVKGAARLKKAENDEGFPTARSYLHKIGRFDYNCNYRSCASILAYYHQGRDCPHRYFSNFRRRSSQSNSLLVGAIWVLNRFYSTREDASHIRVDADVSSIPSTRFQGLSSGYSLLIYRVDIINTGKILIEPFQHLIEIHEATIAEGAVTYTTIYRWPESGTHWGGPIEPNSWSAVNDAIAIPNSVQAVGMFQ